MSNAELAEEVSRIMAERELSLGTVECGVDGVVGRTIFGTEDGPAVLGDGLVVDDVQQAVGVLDLPRSRLAQAGIFSAETARAAAQKGLALLGVDLCLVVWGPPPDPPSGPGGPLPVYLALYDGGEVQEQAFEHQGPQDEQLDALVNQALHMVHRALV